MRICTLIIGFLAVFAGAAQAAAPPGASLKFVGDYYDPKTGERRSRIEAERLDPSPTDPKVLLGTDVRVLLYQEGKTHVLTAKKGTANTEKNSGTVDGNVVIVFDDEQATRVETESLAWDGATGKITTDKPVKIIRKDLTADGVGLDVTLREESGPKRPQRADELTLKANVRVVIQPGASNSLLSLGAGARTPAEPGPAKPPEKGEIPPAKAELPRATAGLPSPPYGGSGQADRGTAGAEKREDPIVITSAGPLTIYRGAFTALFRDDVRAVQGSLTITCDILTLVFRPAREDEKTRKGGDETQYVLDTGTAVGKVRVDDTQTAARADMAFWKSKEAKPKEGSAKPPTDPKKDSNRFQEGAVKLIGQPAQVTWGNGDRLCGPVIYRLEGGSEFICSPSEESQGGVHLFTATTKSGLAEPPKKNEPVPKPAPSNR